MQYKYFKTDLIAQSKIPVFLDILLLIMIVETSLILTDDDVSNKANKMYATHKKIWIFIRNLLKQHDDDDEVLFL